MLNTPPLSNLYIMFFFSTYKSHMALAVGVLFLNTALPICPQVRASVNRDLGGEWEEFGEHGAVMQSSP